MGREGDKEGEREKEEKADQGRSRNSGKGGVQ